MLKTVFDFTVSALPGVALCGVGIFAYLTYKKGLPWAVSTVKAWWNKGKAELGNLKGDIAAIDARLVAVEKQLGIGHPAPAPQASSEVHV